VTAHLLAEKSKCFSENELESHYFIHTAEMVCPNKVHAFKNISFSWNTVAKGVAEMALSLIVYK
jgi:hypothetical protein